MVDSLIVWIQKQFTPFPNKTSLLIKKKQNSILLLLNGIGGIGKTTLAKQYLQRDGQDYDFVGWIDCQSLRDTHQEYTPTAPVNSLPFEQAKELFQEHCTKAVTEEQLKKLFTLVEYHTLMVEMLAKSYQDCFTSGIEEFLEHLQKREYQDLAFQVEIPIEHSPEDRALFGHLQALYDLSSLSPEQVQLLQQFAVLPSEPFAWDFLQKLFQAEQEQEKKALFQNLQQLKKEGWLLEEGRSSLTINDS